MKVTYTGRKIDLAESQKTQLEGEFAKVGRALDTPKGEAEARVVLSHEHQVNRAEVSVNWHHHELKGHAEHVDLFTAIHAAAERLEKQAHKLQTKWRDSKRVPAA